MKQPGWVDALGQSRAEVRPQIQRFGGPAAEELLVEPCGVREQLVGRDRRVERFWHGHAIDVGVDVDTEIEYAALPKLEDGRGRNRLRDRPDAEKRLFRVGRLPGSDVGVANPLRAQRARPAHDGKNGARDPKRVGKGRDGRLCKPPGSPSPRIVLRTRLRQRGSTRRE